VRTVEELKKKLFTLQMKLYKQKAHLGRGINKTLAFQIELTKGQIGMISWAIDEGGSK